MQHFATAAPDGHRSHCLLRLVMTFIAGCGVGMFGMTPAVFAGDAATPPPPFPANGCPPEWTDQSYICPEPSEAGYSFIEYVYSDRATDGIAIRLTPAGMEKALTCTGATDIGSLVIRHYERIPREERARGSIAWAKAPMINEIHAHARLGQYPALLPAANPVHIDFPHYEGEFGGFWNFGQQIVFERVWHCA